MRRDASGGRFGGELVECLRVESVVMDAGFGRDFADSERHFASRRSVLKVLTATGIGTSAFRRAIAQEAVATNITIDDVRSAEWVAGIELTDQQRDEVIDSVRHLQRQRQQLRSIDVDYDVLPALKFDPEMFDPQSRIRTLDRPTWLKAAASANTEVSEDRDSWSFLTIQHDAWDCRDWLVLVSQKFIAVETPHQPRWPACDRTTSSCLSTAYQSSTRII